MGYHPRIESAELASFQTTRTLNSRLWFINSPELERALLGYAAKYANRYGAKLYALAIEGNHIQFPAHFPNMNRSAFMRDFNSSVARAILRHNKRFLGGRFWARRFSNEFLPGDADIEEYFFYTVLQPVQDGLVEKISDYPGYNCFDDAIWGRTKKYKVVNWKEFNAARKINPNVVVQQYTEIVTLKYARLPGYEHLTQREYAHLMQRKLEERRQVIVAKRKAKGLGFVGRERLLEMTPGVLPYSTKTSGLTSHRPRVLSVCNERRAKWKAWYFSIYFQYKEASRRYRGGDLTTLFPRGTYPPHLACCLAQAA